MSRSLAWLRYAWRRHGAAGLIWLAVYNLLYHTIRRKGPGGRSGYADQFDEKYGTDTSGIREIYTLDVLASPAARYAVRYGPSSARAVRAELDKLQIDYKGFTFIDYGSGKGRVLFVAAGLPFKQVIGIEFSRELHEVALQNIARLPPDMRRCGTVRCIHGDAASFRPPKSDLVCYFHNPFGAPVMAAVAARLMARHAECGYRFIIIYVDPRCREIFEKTGKFVILDETTHTLVLTTRPEAGAAARLIDPDCGLNIVGLRQFRRP